MNSREQIRRLEREVEALRRWSEIAPATLERGGAAQEVFLAQTTTAPGEGSAPSGSVSAGEYPGPNANKFWIRFIDGSFNETPGREALDVSPRSEQATRVVLNLAGKFIPQDTVIWAFEFRGRWYTYWAGAETVEGSSSGSGSNSSSSECAGTIIEVPSGFTGVVNDDCTVTMTPTGVCRYCLPAGAYLIDCDDDENGSASSEGGV